MDSKAVLANIKAKLQKILKKNPKIEEYSEYLLDKDLEEIAKEIWY